MACFFTSDGSGALALSGGGGFGRLAASEGPAAASGGGAVAVDAASSPGGGVDDAADDDDASDDDDVDGYDASASARPGHAELINAAARTETTPARVAARRVPIASSSASTSRAILSGAPREDA